MVPHLRLRSALAGALGLAALARRRHHAERCSRSSIAQAPAPRSSFSAGSPSAIRAWSERFGAAGHDIGSHGHLHTRVYELDAQAFVADLRRSIAALRAAGVERIDGFRAPEWSINDRSLWALECLVREGITLDASMAPVRIVGSVDYPRAPHVRHTPAGPIFEVPPLVVDRFGHAMPIGWGWGLRMTSPRRMLRTIESVNAAGLPAVLTVHPWEIDPEPPRVSLPPRLRFAHYFRLGGFRERLAALLPAGDFGALSDVPALQASR